jgi:hypothetical protein
MFVQPFLGFVGQPALPHGIAGVVFGAFGTPFLTRGFTGGTGVVTVRGAVVGAGSAAFFVRGTAGLGVVTGLFTGESVVGTGFEAWATPEAVMPPPIMVRATRAARAGRSFVIRAD